MSRVRFFRRVDLIGKLPARTRPIDFEPEPIPETFEVFSSPGVAFISGTTVLNSSNVQFEVPTTVLDSSGTGFNLQYP